MLNSLTWSDGNAPAAGLHGAMSVLAGIVIGTLGLLTIGDCITALINRATRRSDKSGSNADLRPVRP